MRGNVRKPPSFARVLAVSALAASLVLGCLSTAGAQEMRQPFNATDVEVTWSPPWQRTQYFGSIVGDGDLFEVLLFAAGTSTFAVAAVPSSYDLEAAQLAIVATALPETSDGAVIERGVTCSLNLFGVSDSTMGSYTELIAGTGDQPTLVNFLVADIDNFATEVGSIQSSVMIGGTPALEGVDGQALQDLLASESAGPSLTPLSTPDASEGELDSTPAATSTLCP